ncbi:hypothetical protein GGF31_009024 [Allomyces arbusculus]|nr:hypothetical protein GGF31_009024 [Allomyces arbusculus]
MFTAVVPADIVIEADAWSSANLSTYIAATLLQDVMGVNVTVLEYDGDYSGSFSRIASGRVHANLELWPNAKSALYQQYIVQQGTVEDSGMIGYAAKISWYINTAIANAYPTLIFDSWRSYTMNSVLQYLPAYGTTTPARKADGSWLCDSATYSYCSNGMFVPPQCQANPSGCREYWHVDPSYNVGENEQRIITLGLKLVVVYLGAAFASAVTRCANQNSYACLFYYWKPEIIPSTLSLSVVSLPEYNSTCFSQFSAARVGASSNELVCDTTSELLMKISTASLRLTAPHVSMFFKQFSLKDHDINFLLNDYATTGVTETTACKWITSNRNLWTAWIPAPPSNYIMTLDSMASSEVLPILVVVLCGLVFAATLPTFHLLSRYAGTATVKAQSPRFMQLIALGVFVVTASVALEIASPTITGICAARIWLLALGMCTILGSIIVKTARIYLIFGNRYQMQFNLKDTRLLGGVVAIVAVDVVLLGAWTGAAVPSAVISTVSTTTYTYLCSTGSDTGGTAITAILAIFHASQLLVACWLSFKIRNVATNYNESKYIALAVYNNLLACAVVIPVVVLPINFRAQFVIKCVCILLALGGVLGLLVWRPILEVVLARAASHDGISAFRSPLSGKLDRGNSLRNAMAKSDKGDDGVLCGLEARVGQRFAIKQMGGLLRRWTEVDVVLFHHPLPALLITPCSSPNCGQAFTFKVYASPADGVDDCFVLRVGGSSYLVQAKDAADADRWIRDIEFTFKTGNASTAGSVSRSPSVSGSGAPSPAVTSGEQPVAGRRPLGPQRSGIVG